MAQIAKLARQIAIYFVLSKIVTVQIWPLVFLLSGMVWLMIFVLFPLLSLIRKTKIIFVCQGLSTAVSDLASVSMETAIALSMD